MFAIEFDDTAVRRLLGRAAASAIPRAMAGGLNDGAFAIRAATPGHIERRIDNPRPFTKSKSGLYVKKASAAGLEAEVGFRPAQAAYLRIQETGGGVKGVPLAAPSRGARGVRGGADRFGNVLPQIKKAKGRTGFFIGAPRRRDGEWPLGIYRVVGARSARRLVRLAAFLPRATYGARLRWREEMLPLAQETASRAFLRRLVDDLSSES